RRFRVSAAQPHEGNGRAPSDADATTGRPRHAPITVDRPGEFQPRLPDARNAPIAEARRQAGMAAHSGLLVRKRRVSRYRSKRSALRLSMTMVGVQSPIRLRRAATICCAEK